MNSTPDTRETLGEWAAIVSWSWSNACPCGCGFEWQGSNPKPPTRTHRLATLIALVRRLRPKHLEQVHAFAESLTTQSAPVEQEAA